MMFRLLTENEYIQNLGHFINYHFNQSASGLLYYKIMYKEFWHCGYFIDNSPVILYRFAKVPCRKIFNCLIGSFGPVINLGKVNQKIFDDFIRNLRGIRIKNLSLYFQVYPVSLNREDNTRIEELLNSCKYLKKSKQKKTWIDGTILVYVTSTQEEILKRMRNDVRYNIKRAERDGKLSLKIVRDLKYSDEFFDIYNELQKRKGFKDHAVIFYKKLIEERIGILFLAYDINGILQSGVLAVDYKEQNSLITYISSSRQEGYKLRAPTFVRWNVIKWANENGYRTVDFFSVVNSTPDVNAFKEGFGGEKIMYIRKAYQI